MEHLRKWLTAALIAACIACIGGCSEPQGPVASRKEQQMGWAGSRILPWNAVGLDPGGPEQRAHGVQAVAIDSVGIVHLLDPLNRRVLRIRADGTDVAARVPVDTEDLAIGPDGSLAVYSPLRARVWIHAATGRRVGELAVPRVFRHVRGIGLGPSRQVTLHNAFQETMLLGSPLVPQPLEAVMHSKRKGEHRLGDGTGVAIRLQDRRPEILLFDGSDVVARHALTESVLAARVFGVIDGQICLRLEQLVSEPPLQVGRTAVCIDASSGQRTFEQKLSPVGLYVPRRELAVGGNPPRMAFIHPEQQGLRLQVWPLEGVEQ